MKKKKKKTPTKDAKEFAKLDSDARGLNAIISGFGGTLSAGVVTFQLATGKLPFYRDAGAAETYGDLAVYAVLFLTLLRAILPTFGTGPWRASLYFVGVIVASFFAFYGGWLVVSPAVFLFLFGGLGELAYLRKRPIPA